MITYNHEDYIREAIEGVLMQETNFDFEFIVVNDKSTDATESIILTLIKNHAKGNLINFFSHTENKGMMANFIFALQQCKGEYIALCDGDDYWTDTNKLQKQVDFLESNSAYVICFHKVDILNPDGSITKDFITEVPENHETIEALASFGNYIHTPSVVFRNIVNEFPCEFLLSPVGDYFLYMILAQHGRIKYLQETMGIYRSDVGVISKMSYIDVHYSEVRFYSCIASYLPDVKLKKIFIDRQLSALKKMERVLNTNNKTYFIKDSKILKCAMYVSEKYKKLLKLF